ncbi:unnamed protein product, partial [Parnassius mnemosyne]
MGYKKCCVYGCNSTNETHRFFSFPRNDKLRNLWMSFIAPTNPKLIGLSKDQLLGKHVCEKHFDRYQFDYEGKRLRYSYPCLITEEEIAHGVPLTATGWDVINEHNYCKEQDEDNVTEGVVEIRMAGDCTNEHNYNKEQDDLSKSLVEIGSSDVGSCHEQPLYSNFSTIATAIENQDAVTEQPPSASTKAMEIDVLEELEDEDHLPQELISVISDGLPSLLVPPALEPGEAGLQWLQVIGALCDSSETHECVMQEVSPDSFENTLYSVLQYTSQNGPVGTEVAQQAVIVSVRTALTLTPLSREWEAALNRLLAHHQVRKSLCAGLTSNDGARRIQVLQLVKHQCFPSDQMNQVFGESLHNVSDISAENTSPRTESESKVSWAAQRLTPAEEHATHAPITKRNYALHSDKDVTDHMASLQHALTLLQDTNSTQQDVLYTTQMQNEEHKKTIDELHKQLEDAEITLWDFRAKLAAERLYKENQKKELKAEINNMENEMKRREKEVEERLKQAEIEYKALQNKLEQQ